MLHLQSSPLRRRRVRAVARCAGLFVLGILVGLGCSTSDEADPISSPDSGPSCEPGAAGCECTSSGGCRDDLLCTVGRCLRVENSGNPDEPEPGRPLPSRPNPTPELPADASVPDASDGAVAPDAATPDAAVDSEADSGTEPLPEDAAVSAPADASSNP